MRTEYQRGLMAAIRGVATGAADSHWMKIPQVIDHCWRETRRPRMAGGVISAW